MKILRITREPNHLYFIVFTLVNIMDILGNIYKIDITYYVTVFKYLFREIFWSCRFGTLHAPLSDPFVPRRQYSRRSIGYSRSRPQSALIWDETATHRCTAHTIILPLILI